jgi:hypothetical protein
MTARQARSCRFEVATARRASWRSPRPAGPRLRREAAAVGSRAARRRMVGPAAAYPPPDRRSLLQGQHSPAAGYRTVGHVTTIALPCHRRRWSHLARRSGTRLADASRVGARAGPSCCKHSGCGVGGRGCGWPDCSGGPNAVEDDHDLGEGRTGAVASSVPSTVAGSSIGLIERVTSARSIGCCRNQSRRVIRAVLPTQRDPGTAEQRPAQGAGGEK